MTRRFARSLSAAVLLSLVGLPTVARAQETAADDDAEIRRVIASAYIDGLHGNGSRDDIRAGFHPSFVMKVLRNGEITDVGIEEWIGRLPEPGTDPGHEIAHRIPEVSVSGDAAAAMIEVDFDGRHVFSDYMLLYRFPEGWRIVAKVFHSESS